MSKRADDGRVSIVRIDLTARTMAVALLMGGGCWVLLRVLPVVLVIVVALFLVGTLSPAVEWLETKGWRRGWGIGTIFFAMLVMTLLVFTLTLPSLVDQVTTVVKREPALRRHFADVLARSRMTMSLAESLRNVRYEVLARSAAATAFEYSARVVEIVAYGASAIFLALYMMLDRDRLRGALFAVVPRTHHIRLSRVMLNLETIVGGYIRGQVLTSAFMALFTFVLLTSCRVSNALAIAVFAGVADVLPYIGVFLSVGPAVLAALAQGPATTAIVLVAMIAYEEFESRFLVPRIYGRALRLPSSIVLVALLAGGTLMGIVGALLALPVAAAVRMLVEELRVDLPGEELDDTTVRARDQRAEDDYERRAEGIPAEQAAAIAVEISERRRDEEGGIVSAGHVVVAEGETAKDT